MKNELKKVTEEWMQLERMTLEQRKNAELFYDEKLMKLIEKEFLKNNKEIRSQKADYLIISVGTSYEPLVLSIQFFNPKKILFLCTEVTEKVLDKIVKYCELESSRYQKRRVHETDPTDVYREIKQAYLEWGRPEKLFIDFTGGTKSMAAAAAMAGAMIQVQMVYVGCNDYLVDFRKPYPGSEKLYFIENPLSIFGDLEIEKAMVLFDRANFSGAREKLEELKERIPDPNLRQQMNFVYLLALMYEYWDSLDFCKAYEVSVQLNKELKRDYRLHRTFVLMDCLDQLECQEHQLEALKEIPIMIHEKKNFEVLKNNYYMIPLMFTMYSNAMLREKQEKYDMATLLLYRLLEMIEQRRLSLYGLYVSKMDYTGLVFCSEEQKELNQLSGEEKLNWLKEEVYQLKRQLFKRADSRYFPEQISLLEGFILLSALQDGLFKEMDRNSLEQLKRIRAMVFLRNNSIFAHGLGPVPQQDYKKFRSFVEELFIQFCRVEEIAFGKWIKEIQWVNPSESVYYSKLEV